ncbi:MAG: hypothetical protein NTY21_04065 [Actinobacteria bacterium]|nr:hypothetical protein [Actinomycetota bacterium]
MRKLLVALLVFVFIGSGVAYAHQPVTLIDSDVTAAKGPLLVDGTVSFAVRASFTKPGQKKAFRAQFKSGDALSVQYLIVDKKPESSLRISALPTLVITTPTGSKVTIALDERTKFYEPFSRVNYLYLARYSAVAQSGVYSFTITSRAKSSITVAVGDREVSGEVLRETLASQTPSPTSSSPLPAPSKTVSASPTPPSSDGFTMAQVRTNNSATSCWAVINGSVYNLTTWINSHPGGSGAIISLCGTDATSAFTSKHGSKSGPNSQLAGFRLGPLSN